MRTKLIIIGIIAAFMVSGCAGATRQEKGAAIGVGAGAATGALLGQAIGRNTGSTLLGAAAGAVVGGIAGSMIGTYMDDQERDFQRQVAGREGTTVQRQQNDLAITMKSDVLFDTGSSALKPGAEDEIARIAQILNRYPATRVTVEGHTDSRGSENRNMRLSEERARAVADSLTARGVDPSRLTTVGLGASRPIASNNTESGRQLNRRVTLVVTPIEA